MRMRVVGGVLVILALTGCGGGGEGAPGMGRAEELWRYCSYGAVSRPQLRGCLTHVRADQVGHGATNAHEYGEGHLDRCLADSGPFCGAPPPEFVP